MRIALVCPYDITYPGGVQNQVIQFAERARNLGHDVTLVAPNSREPGYDNFFSAGKAVPVPIGPGTVSRLTFSFWNRRKLEELLANGGFDVVHVHSPEAPILGPLALRYANTESAALLTTSHSNSSPNPVTFFYSSMARLLGLDRLIEKAYMRIAVSKAAAKLANHYMPGNYTIIPNGIDIGRFSPGVKPIPSLDDKTNILFVGRLGENEKRKGLYYLVSAFNELHWRHPGTRLLVVGPGEPDRNTRNLVNAIDNKDIVLTGPVSASDLPRYYSAADIFAATPTDGESFSLVVAEAMASGKPVVTTNIPGPREVLLGSDKDNSAHSNILIPEAGILVPPRDAGATAAALEWLVTNPSERIRMGLAGRQIVAENFSWEKVTARILEAYEAAMAAKGGDNKRRSRDNLIAAAIRSPS